MSAIWDAVTTAAGLFWRAAWALAFGYTVSAAIQVFVSRRQAARHLGGGSPRQLGLAMLLGFASSPARSLLSRPPAASTRRAQP